MPAESAHLIQASGRKLTELRADFTWLQEDSTSLVRPSNDRLIWRTFGSLFANAALAAALRNAGARTSKVDNFAIALDANETTDATVAVLNRIKDRPPEAFASPVADRALEGLKFSVCLPEGLARRVLQDRTTDRKALGTMIAAPTRVITLRSDPDQ